MSIVIVLIMVLIVGGLIAKFYPKPKPTTFLAPGETFTPEELAPETAVVIEPLVESKVITEAPKMNAKSKKKPQPKKKPATKVDA